MITCPECGQQAPDDAKFCDRCGQGLSKSASSSAQSSPTRPTPLAAGAMLRGGIEIVALTSQTSIENRYSAKRTRDDKTESIALRERLGPNPPEAVEEAPARVADRRQAILPLIEEEAGLLPAPQVDVEPGRSLPDLDRGRHFA